MDARAKGLCLRRAKEIFACFGNQFRKVWMRSGRVSESDSKVLRALQFDSRIELYGQTQCIEPGAKVRGRGRHFDTT